jgi:signal transduction histidine kinase
LNGLLGIGEIVLEEMCSTQENNELRDAFEQSRRRILSILDDALLLTEIDVDGERFRSGPVCLSAVLAAAIEKTADLARSRRVVITSVPEGSSLVLGNEELFIRALHALLETAVKFSDEDGTVHLSRGAMPDSVVIESRGRAIPGLALPKFFDLFSVSESSTPAGDLGLGPPVASRILSLFGASVTVANQDPSGIRFTILLKGCGVDPVEIRCDEELSIR